MRMGLALHLHCPTRQQDFDSGIKVAPEALPRIVHIEVRLRCPICYEMYSLIEKGDLNEPA